MAPSWSQEHCVHGVGDVESTGPGGLRTMSERVHHPSGLKAIPRYIYSLEVDRLILSEMKFCRLSPVITCATGCGLHRDFHSSCGASPGDEDDASAALSTELLYTAHEHV